MRQSLLKPLAFGSVLLSLGLALAAGPVSYHQSVDAAERKAADLARLVEESTRRSLAEAEAMLRAVVQDIGEIDEADFRAGSRLARRLEGLHDGVDTAAVLFVVSADGRVRFMTDTYPPPPVDLGDRPYMAFHRDHSDGTMVTGVVGRATGQAGFTVSRRLNHADGRFGGVVLVSFFAHEFVERFSAVDAGPKSAFAVLDFDGNLIVRRPLRVEDYGRSSSSSPLYSLLEGADSGIYRTAASILDGEGRIVAWRKIGHYPLVAVAGISTAEVWDGWLRNAGLLLASAVPALIGCLLFARAALRHAAEGQVARLRLEEMVAERTQDLAAALSRAERAKEARGRFLAAASHDLRQPLQALRLFIDLLVAKPASGGAEVLPHMNQALASAERLLRSILDLSRAEAGTVPIEPVPFVIGDLLRTLEAEFAPAAGQKGARLTVVPSSAVVRGDPVVVQRIVGNLVSNAVKYAGTGRILLGCRRRGRTVRVEVWDEGPGVPPDKAELIFEEFYQIGNDERDSAKGLGIGLSIARRLAELGGHRLGLYRPLRGSCFWLALPITEPAAAAPARPGVALTGASPAG